MKTTMKRPNAEMLVKIESMINEFAKIRTIAATLQTQVVTVYRYANHLGYRNVMISAQEMDMIVKHRAGLIKAKLNTEPTASATPAAVEPTVQALD